ncbi:hypothetical protein ACSBR2_035166 [Camellia fascicularis]
MGIGGIIPVRWLDCMIASPKSGHFKINNFNGSVSAWFGNLPKLQYLLLANNSFNGWVLPSFGKISALESINLRYNFLEGRVLEEIGYLSKLQQLHM